jgi:hypothetical protein
MSITGRLEALMVGKSYMASVDLFCNESVLESSFTHWPLGQKLRGERSKSSNYKHINGVEGMMSVNYGTRKTAFKKWQYLM